MQGDGIPATMHAAVYRAARQLSIERRPVPEPGEGEVLLRVSHCGVCGSDLHFVLDGWGRPDSIGGHEFSGHVVRVGPGVLRFRVGDAVVALPEAACGRCEFCLDHRPALCSGRGTAGVSPFQGAFAEYVRAGVRQIVPVPDGLSTREAALAEPLAVALHAISRSGIRPGESALVTGAGPIGMLVLAALRARGVGDVWVSEPSPVRRDLAVRVGATRAVLPDELPFPSMPFELVEDARHVAFECSGRPRAFASALAQLRRGGTLVVVGTGMEKPNLDPNRVLLNELTVTGAYNYDENGLGDALELLASGGLPTGLLIEPEDVPLSGLLEAMERLEAGRIGGKVLVAPGTED